MLCNTSNGHDLVSVFTCPNLWKADTLERAGTSERAGTPNGVPAFSMPTPERKGVFSEGHLCTCDSNGLHQSLGSKPAFLSGCVVSSCAANKIMNGR